MKKEKTEQLIHTAKTGDPDAFEQLISLHNRDMYRTASAILMNDEDAADAIQDTILACWKNLKLLKSPQYFKTWLIRILINKCCRILDKRTESTSIEEVPETGKPDLYNLEFKEALSRLKEEYRLVTVLYYCEGYKTKEIADMLDVPDATVRTRLKRARAILKDYYEEEPL